MKHWRLKSKEERRFKQGHPWVYSNELQESPKGIQAGELLELSDAGGQFLAYGFGNPNSLIAFRALSREKIEVDNAGERRAHDDQISLLKKIIGKNLGKAFAFRQQWFSPDQSYRAVFGEADDLPGLIIDRYKGDHAVYVVQPHSAGMDLHLSIITEALAKISIELGDSPKTKVIYRRDAGSREREGLTKEPTKVCTLHTGEEIQSFEAYREFSFQLQSLMGREVSITADLIAGQKTGFFFDQAQNIKIVQTLLLRKLRYLPEVKNSTLKKFELLDLCSYVGQWSVQLSQVFLEKKLPLSITAVDASESALKLAELNVKKNALAAGEVTFSKLKADVLEPMPTIKDAHYEVVVADPPAFIKNRKSIPQGKHAYVQLFTTAIQKTAKNGLVVCCSCSQLLSPEELKEVLQKASKRSGRKVRWLAQGSPSLDHFMKAEFEEGHYLKCWIGAVE